MAKTHTPKSDGSLPSIVIGEGSFIRIDENGGHDLRTRRSGHLLLLLNKVQFLSFAQNFVH